ncbi:MAG: DsbA family protein [Gammaproteobacteria bacterium]|nr:DsbA family protein [Gammaproteobacteria bacterium]
MADLLYFADPMCSWCYGYSSVINALAETHNVEVVMGGLRAGETRPLNTGYRQQIQNHWHHVQQATQLPFDFENGIPEGFVYNTEPACRAVVTVQALIPEYSLPMLAAIQQAFYAQAKNVTDTNVLAELATEFGIAQPMFLLNFESDEMLQATQAQFERAQQYAVAGYPTLLIKREERWRSLGMGYEPLQQVEEKIAAIAA